MLKKERNFIIYEKEEGKTYKLDINKGVWYGLKGQTMLTVPSSFVQQLKGYKGDNVLIKCLQETINWNYCSCKQATTEYADNLIMLDKLIIFLQTINKKLSVTYVNNRELTQLRDKDYLKKVKDEFLPQLKDWYEEFAKNHKKRFAF